MELLSVHYDNLPKLLNALKTQGVRNINAQRNQGLTGKKSWQQFEKNYACLQINSKFPLTYEVVYGHAWKGAPRQLSSGVETFIPVTQIVKR
ncbi:MAG: malonyl-[acyl-carrier protein] O-methyltransferase BioC, partial [bacterium]|nr:malonyl-[acyl-carrier protein] O-methyltransferase BioC [bacterium]